MNLIGFHAKERERSHVSVEKETAEELVRPRTFQAYEEMAEREVSQPHRETREREYEHRERPLWMERDEELELERDTGMEID